MVISNIRDYLKFLIDIDIIDVIDDNTLQSVQNVKQSISRLLINMRPKNAIDVDSILADNAYSHINTIDDILKELERFPISSIRVPGARTVLYDGILDASVLLVGEAPGAEEDLQGIPFCGKSGQLLDKILGMIGLSRKTNLYITNSVFWRPLNNRKPNSDEISTCRPFVIKQIEIIKPKLIIACGATALESLTNMNHGITEISGKEIKYNNSDISLVPLLHPSYLLRNPIAKKRMWFDILNIESIINRFQI